VLYVNSGAARGYCGDPAICVLLCFRRGVNKTSTLLGFYVTCVGSLVPTFRHDISVPFSWAQQFKKDVYRE
jgi:hypothetical protein